MPHACSLQLAANDADHDGRTTAAQSAILPKSNSLNFIVVIVSSSEQQRWQQKQQVQARGEIWHINHQSSSAVISIHLREMTIVGYSW
jgi:hypothetical protein